MDEKIFQTVLNIKSVGKGKLSITLFYTNPELYIPLDSNTVSHLRSIKQKYFYDSFASYEKLSKEIVKDLRKKPWNIFHTKHTIMHPVMSQISVVLEHFLESWKKNWNMTETTASSIEGNLIRNMD